jgi:hypothetical protein
MRVISHAWCHNVVFTYTDPANKSPFRFYRAENDLRRGPPKRTAYRSRRANFKAAEEIVESRVVRPEPP